MYWWWCISIHILVFNLLLSNIHVDNLSRHHWLLKRVGKKNRPWRDSNRGALFTLRGRLRAQPLDHLDSNIVVAFFYFDKDIFAYNSIMKVKIKIWAEKILVFLCSICWSLNYVPSMFWGWVQLHYITLHYSIFFSNLGYN